jgi:hypothetical protein
MWRMVRVTDGVLGGQARLGNRWHVTRLELHNLKLGGQSQNQHFTLILHSDPHEFAHPRRTLTLSLLQQE